MSLSNSCKQRLCNLDSPNVQYKTHIAHCPGCEKMAGLIKKIVKSLDSEMPKGCFVYKKAMWSMGDATQHLTNGSENLPNTCILQFISH